MWKKFFNALRNPWVRLGICVAVLAALVIVAREHLHFIGDSWHALRSADWRWVGVAVGVLAVSMIAQAEVMVALLRSTGVKVRRWQANVLGLSANAWSASFPGGAAISAAMIFRSQMKWGATAVIASWYMVISGLLATAGMAALALPAIYFFGLKVSPTTIVLSVIPLVALVLGINYLAKRPESVERWVIERARGLNRWLKKPEDRFTESIQGLGTQLRTIQISPLRLAYAFLAALMNWIFEILCLIACVYAVGGTPAIAGIVLSFLAAKLVGQAQITPSGLGTMDIALISTLVPLAELPSGEAFAAVIVFRTLSFALLTAVGWLVYFATQATNPDLLTRAQRREAEATPAPDETTGELPAAAAEDPEPDSREV